MQTLEEAKKQKSNSAPAYTGPKVVLHTGTLYNETAAKHSVNTKGAQSALEDFIKAKMSNPTEDFGKKDYLLGNKGHFGKAIPGLKHAGLTHDVSVFYTVSGSNPHHIHLHGVFGHDDAGIGQPPNIQKQKSVSKRMSNQEFLD